jgi:hypothetical protein
MGQVIVMEYHHIRPGKGGMFRSQEDFRKDLERLYRMGFRPVTISEYLENRMDLPPGASPVVMTFDDSSPTQFRMLDDGSVDPESGVGIWLKFSEEQPDFPVKGVFYVLPDVMWAQPAWIDKKIEMLHGWGSELGNHSMTHARLDRLTDQQVKKELGEAINRLEGWGQKSPVSLALPFGIFPKNRDLVKSFEYNGRKYELSSAMLVGANPAPSPEDPKFDKYRIPRMQAYDGDSGSDYWLDQVENGRVQVYVAP